MAEQRMVFVGLFPILLILVVLVIFGVTWLFHHHHWRPFAGLFLLIAGLACLWTLVRWNAGQPVAVQLPRSIRPPWESSPQEGKSSDMRGPTLIREYMSKEQRTSETPAAAPQGST